LYQLQNILKKNFEFSFVCVDHNEQHNDGWKSSILLKLVIFTIHVVNAKLLIAINHSISRNFQQFKMD
jgi:hypothetical protein